MYLTYYIDAEHWTEFFVSIDMTLRCNVCRGFVVCKCIKKVVRRFMINVMKKVSMVVDVGGDASCILVSSLAFL